MTQGLATMDPGRRAPTAGPPSRVQQVAAGLARSAEDFEAPYDRVRGSLRDMRAVLKSGVSHYGTISSRREAHLWREHAPPLSHLQRLAAEAQRLSSATPNVAVTQLLLGMMLDAFPNAGREAREGYFATLVHELVSDGYGPSVVAVACRHLRRSAKFLPTVSEVLAQCTEAQEHLASAKRIIEAALARTEEADAVLAKPEERDA